MFSMLTKHENMKIFSHNFFTQFFQFQQVNFFSCTRVFKFRSNVVQQNIHKYWYVIKWLIEIWFNIAVYQFFFQMRQHKNKINYEKSDFICHVIIFCDNVKFNFIFFVNFINCVIAVCCVGHAESHHIKWCKLKFFRNMCFAFVFNCFSINDSVNGLFIETYNSNDELYILCMCIILILFFERKLIRSVQIFVDENSIFHFCELMFLLT